MTVDKQSEARRKALRRLLRDDAARVEVPTADLRWLLDEVGRLQQGNDRLRRQNRRLRLARGGTASGAVVPGADAAGEVFDELLDGAPDGASDGASDGALRDELQDDGEDV